MTSQSHQHHSHAPGQPHPQPPTLSPSILRMSAVERLAAVAVVIALIWAAVHWAVS